MSAPKRPASLLLASRLFPAPLLLLLGLCLLSHPAQAQLRVRLMAANLTSGSSQTYSSGEGIRLFQGVDPDVVMIQEFNYKGNTEDDIREFVDDTFGTSFSYFREESDQIPNGVISRFPILDAGEWNDTEVSNRDFAWARIDLPGSQELFVVSVHWLTSDSGSREAEAKQLVSYIKDQVPSSDFLAIGGDLNTPGRSENAITVLSSVVVTVGPYPADQERNDNTNAGRTKPYDWLLVDRDLLGRETALVIGSSSYPQGLVLDSRVYTPLEEIAPVEFEDSASTNMQHMAVLRDFLFYLDNDDDGALSNVDCNDNHPQINPGQEELVDGLDNDCDGRIDEDTVISDDDLDGYSEEDGDCDDADPTRAPDATEVLDEIDNDCDGLVDEETEAYDDDGDGFSEQEGDCDDGDPNRSPTQLEAPDGLDNDCDALIDEGTPRYDDDGDGLSEEDGDCDDGNADIHPQAAEVSDGLDNNCNGQIDETDPTPGDDGGPAGCQHQKGARAPHPGLAWLALGWLISLVRPRRLRRPLARG